MFSSRLATWTHSTARHCHSHAAWTSRLSKPSLPPQVASRRIRGAAGVGCCAAAACLILPPQPAIPSCEESAQSTTDGAMTAASAVVVSAAVVIAATANKSGVTEEPPVGAHGMEAALVTISLDEVRKHCTSESLWVTYDGEVYDVTDLLAWHPGGKEPLLGAGGLDLAAFWEKYPIHFKTTKALDRLAKCKIGVLSDEDRQKAEKASDPETAGAARRNHIFQSEGRVARSVTRARQRQLKKFAAVFACMATVPLWATARTLVCVLGCLFPRLAHKLAAFLPVSVPGYDAASRLTARKQEGSSRPRVAVVGGGIAGCSAAYSLQASGFEVTLYEPRAILGGNAERHTFHHNDKAITQDLTVLFWAPELYKNYCALLKALGIAPATVQATYALKTNKYGHDEWYTPPGTDAEQVLRPSLAERFPEDFRAFDRMVKKVRRINNMFTLDPNPSFYKHTTIWAAFNPLNFIQLKTMCRWSGLSREFYETVLRPFHGWNFSTIHIDTLPAVAIGALDEVVPLTSTRKHESWDVGSSLEVFEKMTKGVDVRLNSRVEAVCQTPGGVLRVRDEHGNSSSYDRVVLACPAGMAANVLKGNWLERTLLDSVIYQDDFAWSDWKDWLHNPVHTDTRVVPGTPEQQRAQMRDISFIVDVDVEKKHAEFTCIFGSWSPAAKAAGEHGAPMFVTQSAFPHRPIDDEKIEAYTSAPRAHPKMCLQNLMITQLLPFVQGRRGVYFCSNWVTAGNGHDLSCLAGLSVASAIGAEYPFADQKEVALDYRRMCAGLGLPVAPSS